MSKLSTHVSGTNRRNFGDFLRIPAEAKNPVSMVFALNQNVWADIQQYSPTTILIYRDTRYGTDVFDDAFFARAVEQAQASGYAWVSKYAPIWALNKANYYAFMNEPGNHATEPYKRYNAFCIGAMTRANELGVKLVLYDWSTGCPDLALLSYLLPSLIMAKSGGHLLALHEYSLDGPMITTPPSDLILRYRKLWALLPVEAQCDFAITEGGPDAGYAAPLRGLAYLNAVSPYDEEVMKDTYVLGVALFDLGNTESNMQDFLPMLGQYVATHPTTTVVPPVDPPVTDLNIVVVENLIPQDTTKIEEAYVLDQTYQYKQDIQWSADTARFLVAHGLTGSKVIVWEPSRWTNGDIISYLGVPTDVKHFPGSDTLLNVAYVNQLDGTDADYAPGDCGPADLTMALNFYGKSLAVDQVSIATGLGAGFLDATWANLDTAAKVFGYTVDPHINCLFENVKSEIGAKRPVIALINYAMLPARNKREPNYAGGHYLLIVGYNDREVIYHDPDWHGQDGKNRRMTWAEFDLAWSTPNASFSNLREIGKVLEYVSPTTAIKVGLHDISGAEWMLSNSKTGVALDHVCVTNSPVDLDYTRFSNAGIDVLVRLNYGYADGTGTMPKPDTLSAFETAVVATMKNSRGVKCFIYCNEVNNSSEWPTRYSLTSDYYVSSYNRVRASIPTSVKMGPGAIDPYFGPGSNNREWWVKILGGITGADALFLHPKTQSNDANEVDSYAKFSDDPLKWQYLHFRTLQTSLEVVPTRFKALPVYLTECNPQRTPTGLGWLSDNTAWIQKAKSHVLTWNSVSINQQVTGMVFYRWADDDWRLSDKPNLLNSIFT